MTDPLSWTAPIPLSMLREAALEEVQVSTADKPGLMLCGCAERVTCGADAGCDELLELLEVFPPPHEVASRAEPNITTRIAGENRFSFKSGPFFGVQRLEGSTLTRVVPELHKMWVPEVGIVLDLRRRVMCSQLTLCREMKKGLPGLAASPYFVGEEMPS